MNTIHHRRHRDSQSSNLLFTGCLREKIFSVGLCATLCKSKLKDNLIMQHSPITRVIQREWQRMTSRRLYFGVCLVLPLFTLFFMATIFGNGQMENIPIGIVDRDNTATSRDITRRMSAVPTFRVTRHFVDEAEARKAVQQKEIYGYLSIPPRFEQDMISGSGRHSELLLSLCPALGGR
mgnify:CR=1 FL=1